MKAKKVALVTGAAQRVGAQIARFLHAQGMNVIIHYRHSAEAAQALEIDLTKLRPTSVALLQGDLHNTSILGHLVAQAVAKWGRLDVLINNASSFYPTPVGTVTEQQWDDLFVSNVKAPFFLSQAASESLKQSQGCIVNIVDIHGQRPLENHPVYSMAKAALIMQTYAMASELGPEIRVNAVAPGAILWPEGVDMSTKAHIVASTALKRVGDPQDIAQAVWYLIATAQYTTGQVLAVDGGRLLSV